jgi:hypothetical protein
MSYADGVDVLGAVMMAAVKPSTTAIRPQVAVVPAPAPLPAPTAIRPSVISAPVPVPTAVRPQPVVSAPTTQQSATAVISPQVIKEVTAAVEELKTSAPAMKQSEVARKSVTTPTMKQSEVARKSVTTPTMKPGVSADAKARASQRSREAKQGVQRAAARLAAIARRLSAKRGRASSKLLSVSKRLLDQSASIIVGEEEMTDAEFLRGAMNALNVWFTRIQEAEALAIAGDIIYSLELHIPAMRAAGHTNLADRGQNIIERCQLVIEGFAFDSGSGIVAKVGVLQAEAQAWLSEAQTGGGTSDETSETFVPPDDLPGGGGGTVDAAASAAEDLFAPSEGEGAVDWGEPMGEPSVDNREGGPMEMPEGGGGGGGGGDFEDASWMEARTEEYNPDVDFGDALPPPSQDEFAQIDLELKQYEGEGEEEVLPEVTEKPARLPREWRKEDVYEVGEVVRYAEKLWVAARTVEPPWFPFLMKSEVPGESDAWVEKKAEKKEADSSAAEDDVLGSLVSSNFPWWKVGLGVLGVGVAGLVIWRVSR